MVQQARQESGKRQSGPGSDRLPCTRLSQERRGRLLAAARITFREHGFAQASVGEIMAQAGGSRGTLYHYFDNKLGLFQAVMWEEARWLSKALSDTMHSLSPEANSLRAVAERLSSVATSPRAIDLLRMLIADGHRYPDIGNIYKEVISFLHGEVRQHFRKHAPANRPSAQDADFCADLLLACVVADAQLSLLTGAQEMVDDGGLAERIDRWLQCCGTMPAETATLAKP